MGMNRRVLSQKTFADTARAVMGIKNRINKSFEQLGNLVNLGIGVTVRGNRDVRLIYPCQRFYPAPGFDQSTGLQFTEVVFEELVDRAGRIIFQAQAQSEKLLTLIDQFLETLYAQITLEFLVIQFESARELLAGIQPIPPPLEHRPAIQANAPALI
jgi:hypothetical protein